MSRPAGQVSVTQALAGAGVAVAFVAATIGLCQWLLLPVRALPEFEAPGVPAACPDSAILPDTVTSAMLVDCPDVFDGRQVTYQGEAVGAVLLRGERAWVQLNDDPYALVLGPLPSHRTAVGGNAGVAVSLPVDVARRIGAVGSQRNHGALVAVQGTFRRTDPDDRGGPTIHATRAAVVAGARPVEHPTSARRLVAAGLLLALAAATAPRAVRARRRPP